MTTVPASGAYYYEIFEPNDSLQNFYLKVEYGNYSGTNVPAVRLTIGTATNGAGTLSGNLIGPYVTVNAVYTVPGASAGNFSCYASGGPGRFSVMMWRGGTGNCPHAFMIERSLDASGNYTASHVTLAIVGYYGTTSSAVNQQTLLFAVGTAPAQSLLGQNYGGLSLRIFRPGLTTGGSAFNGAQAFDTVAPMIGYFDYPLTSFGAGNYTDYSEGQIVTTSIYGASHTFIASKTAPLNWSGPANATFPVALLMRYD